MAAPAVYHDFSGTAQLRAQARSDQQGATREVARQFESIFIQIMLKSMRDTLPQGGLFDSDQMTMYQEMFDQQVSLDMSRNGGIGLAAIVERQLGGAPTSDASTDGSEMDQEADLPVRQSPADPFAVPGKQSPSLGAEEIALRALLRKADAAATPVRDRVEVLAPGAVSASGAPAAKRHWRPAGMTEFIDAVRDHAARAARALNVSENLLIAQAALETGWGKKVIRHADGGSSFNLFGIKADQRWQGDRVARQTVEYRNGIARREMANFRSYGSLGEAFSDYVQFLQANGRYSDALQHRGRDEYFARGLQAAGYATDPAYADKILGIKARLDRADAERASTTLALKKTPQASLL